MNERIQELMDQCEEEYSTQNYPCWDMEKFAQLIVKECAGIDFRHKVGMTTDQEFDTGRVILEHFGVEE